MAAGLHLVVSATTASFSAFLSGVLPPAIVHLVRKCSRKHHRTFLAKMIWRAGVDVHQFLICTVGRKSFAGSRQASPLSAALNLSHEYTTKGKEEGKLLHSSIVDQSKLDKQNNLRPTTHLFCILNSK